MQFKVNTAFVTVHTQLFCVKHCDTSLQTISSVLHSNNKGENKRVYQAIVAREHEHELGRTSRQTVKHRIQRRREGKPK